MFITQVNGYTEGDRLDIEFKVSGSASVYAILNCPIDSTPSTGEIFAAVGAIDHDYEIGETFRWYKSVFISGLTDLVILEAL